MGLLAIAVLGIVKLYSFNKSLDESMNNLEIPDVVYESIGNKRIKLAGMYVSNDIDAQLRSVLEQAIGSSFVDSIRELMIISVVLVFVIALISLVM